MSRRDVMVTSGANQAFAHALLAVTDPGDAVVLFRPYYFSHLVALQLLGLRPIVLDCDSRGAPELDELRAALRQGDDEARIKAVVLVSPSNPSGAVCSAPVVAALRSECAAAGAWLISDEAYEHFTFGAAEHVSPAAAQQLGEGDGGEAADGVLGLHTFSKSYGLAAWRVGYLNYPSMLHEPLLKVQDTLPTHACRASQQLALLALEKLGTGWVKEQVQSLQPARSVLWEAVRPLYASSLFDATTTDPPEGAFYYWLPLPPHLASDDEAAVQWFAEDHGLLMLPGSAFGKPGYLRLAYGTLPSAEAAAPVAERLSRAVEILNRGGGPSSAMSRCRVRIGRKLV